jgi:hypothetical protein
VQGSTFVLRLDFCAKNPPHRQAANRQAVKKLALFSVNELVEKGGISILLLNKTATKWLI